jgi:hypothetical protein
MAERELYNSRHYKPFPFEFVSSSFAQSLAPILRKLEQEDVCEPHANFVTALNTILVWSGARTATLPSWNYCDQARLVEFVNYLNTLSRQVPAWAGTIDELIILHRPQIYRSGDGIQQELITRQNCKRVRLTTDPPVGDDEIGRELDMYYPNADNFAAGYDLGETAFSIWEVGSDALLYAEAWSEDFLAPMQIREFIVHCEKRISLWNSAMEKLGLVYRFYGTMDWKRSEIPFHEAVKTKRFCGKEFLGVDSRGKEYGARVNIKFSSRERQGSVGRSVSATA